MPFGRTAIYKVSAGTDVRGILNEARAELTGMVSKQPGFIRYAVVQTAPDEVVSLSAWQSRAQADAAVQSLMGWVQRNLGPRITSAENHVGEIVFTTGLEGPSSGYMRVALYEFAPGTGDAVIARAVDEFAGLLRRQPGFVRYSIIRTGADAGVTISGWESAEQAEAAVSTAAGWVRDALGGSLKSARNHVGEVIWAVAVD